MLLPQLDHQFIIDQQQSYNQIILHRPMNIVNRTVLSQLTRILGTKQTANVNYKTLSHIIGNFYRSQLIFGGPHGKHLFSSLKNSELQQQQYQQEVIIQQSNLTTLLKNTKTISILETKGIKTLFPIQVETFLAVYEGRDILASDRTGSGKTIAYSLPIIEKLRDEGVFKSGKRQVKFLVMCPTRQLCLQVFKQISTLRHNSNDFNVAALYGGAPIDEQIRELKNGADIVVATPGRLMDLLNRKCINFTELQATCIDQADQMLEKGFKLDIQNIFNIIQSQRKQKTQNLMFSATIPEWVDKIAHDFMDKNKKKINLISKSQNQTSTTVEHLAVECSYHDRLNCIQSLIKMYTKEDMRTIIFSETKLEVTDIAMQFGKQAAFLQGDMSQKERQYNLNAFRDGKRRVLVATDVASRGLDIDNVGLVIQLEPPRNTQPFIHRAGRTGRAGKKGICITLFDRKKHLQSMIRIEEQAKMKFNHVAKPHFEQSDQIWSKKLKRIPHDLKKIGSQTLRNPQIELLADVILSSCEDVKQIVKRHLILLAGQPPVSHSLSSDQAGFKTFLIAMKDSETKINTLNTLNFLKEKFEALKITNVHVQNSNIIFDIPSTHLDQIKNTLQNSEIKDSEYQIRQAIFKDRQMVPLKDLARGSRGREGNSFESRGRQRSENRSPVFRENRRDDRREDRRDDRRDDRKTMTFNGQQKIDLFVPGIPMQAQVGDLEEQLRNLSIVYEDIRIKRKSDTNIFAFVTIRDPNSIKQLVRNGIYVQGKKLRVFTPQNKADRY